MVIVMQSFLFIGIYFGKKVSPLKTITAYSNNDGMEKFMSMVLTALKRQKCKNPVYILGGVSPACESLLG